MKTKTITIPFDIELAKKIQAGEYPGKIVTKDGKDVRVVCWDVKSNDGFTILSLLDGEDGNEYHVLRNIIHNDLVLQVPEWTQYKDGDILACEVHNGPNDYCKWFAVLEGNIGFMLGQVYFSSYVSCDYDSTYRTGQSTYNESCDNIGSVRLATEEEKQMFSKRLQEENTAEAKGVLKRFFGIEEKQECEFEPFQKVLVRNDFDEKWSCDFFSHYDESKSRHQFVCVGSYYKYCIPYNEETKHLLGTTDNWEE